MTYEKFTKECNRQLCVAGIGIHDEEFQNATWWKYYRSGMTTRAAIECANKDCGYPISEDFSFGKGSNK